LQVKIIEQNISHSLISPQLLKHTIKQRRRHSFTLPLSDH